MLLPVLGFWRQWNYFITFSFKIWMHHHSRARKINFVFWSTIICCFCGGWPLLIVVFLFLAQYRKFQPASFINDAAVSPTSYMHYLICRRKWLTAKSQNLPHLVVFSFNNSANGFWFWKLILSATATVLIIILYLSEYCKFCWEISGFQMSHFLLLQTACRTAMSQSTGKRTTLSMVLPWVKWVILPIKDRIMTFFPADPFSFVHVIQN